MGYSFFAVLNALGGLIASQKDASALLDSSLRTALALSGDKGVTDLQAAVLKYKSIKDALGDKPTPAQITEAKEKFRTAVQGTPLARLANCIETVSDFVDASTRMIKVRASVENPERALKGEMFVSGEISARAGDGVLVPAQAVFLVGDRHFVFVEEGKGHFKRTEVMRDAEVDGQVAVRTGLKPGERVVTAGSLLLQQMLDSGG